MTQNQDNMHHMDFIDAVRAADVATLRAKEATYQGSWKRAGGRSAWFMLRRNMDRLIAMMAPPHTTEEILQDYGEHTHGAEESGGEIPIELEMLRKLRDAYIAEDLFLKILEHPGGEDGTVLACVRDLRCYATLVEAEMMARGVVEHPPVERGRAATKDPVMAAPYGENRKLVERVRRPDKLYPDMTDDELAAERKRFEDANAAATVWGAAVGARDGFIKAIKREQARRGMNVVERTERVGDVSITEKYADGVPTVLGRVPGDEVPRAGTPEGGGQHASPFPWVASVGAVGLAGVAAEHLNAFYCQRTTTVLVLEPYVVSFTMPKMLQGIYMPRGDSWLLDIRRVPADARSYFPDLGLEKNMHEWQGLPEWQRVLYTWDDGGNKYVLGDIYSEWHMEAE